MTGLKILHDEGEFVAPVEEEEIESIEPVDGLLDERS